MERGALEEISRKGGHAVHAAGKAYRFTKEKAREAGRKGGRALAAKRRKMAEEAGQS
jgi:general stress protein YciG